MRASRFGGRVAACTLAAVSLLSVTALAAPGDEGMASESEIIAAQAAQRTQSGGSALQVGSDKPASAVQAQGSGSSPITVTAEQAQGSFRVVYQDQNGQETSATVTANNPEDVVFACVNAGGDPLRVRQGPGTSYPILCTVSDGNLFPITGKADGWYQISCNGRTGYVSAEFILEKTVDDLLNGGGNTNDGLTDSDYDGTKAQEIVNYALQFKGYPYVYGTAGPNSFDCSGFTSYVFNHFGYRLNRSSRDQLRNGVPVDKSQLQPADLLLFSRDGNTVSHVGLYIGNGKFIHASTSTTGVIISDLYSTYYTNHYYAARRII